MISRPQRIWEIADEMEDTEENMKSPSSADMDKTFIQLPDPQCSSRLMQLPAEIRLAILRNILKHQNPLGHDHVLSMLPGRNSVNYGGQVLHVCQRLYGEASSILYHENVVGIYFTQDGLFDSWSFSTLGQRVSVTRILVLIPIDSDDLPTCIPIRHPLCNSDIEIEHSKVLNNTYHKILPKFNKFRVVIGYEDQEDIAVACHIIRKCLANKEVSIKFELVKSNSRGDPLNMLNDTCPKWLGSTRCLRCKSIQFDGIGDFDTTAYKSVITSQNPVPETIASFIRLHREVFDRMPEQGVLEFTTWRENDIHELYQHAMNYDLEGYEEEKSYLLEDAKTWNADCLLRESGIIRERADFELEKYTEKIRESNARVDAAVHQGLL